jgi:GT2 family glycosyltransferase
MKIAVLIASTGRPNDLRHWLDHIRAQSLQPVQVIWSVADESDLPADSDGSLDLAKVDIVLGPKGSSHQRNTALDKVRPDADLIAFFDDDYVPAARCFEGIARAFTSLPDVIGLTGKLLADGASGPGYTLEEGRAINARYDRETGPAEVNFTPGTLYGCNMVWRASAIKGLRFDENLPLYAWLEDADFSARASQRGVIGLTDAFAGVHLALKNGRGSGVKFGYSQIANAIYLARKGSLPASMAARHTLQHLGSNHVKALRPEKWIDRAGRARGNRQAIWDLLRGRLDPNTIHRL